MAGVLSSELAGISGDPAHPMRQISGSVPGSATSSGNGWTAAVAGNDLTITLIGGAIREGLCILHYYSPALIANVGETSSIRNDNLTVDGSISFQKGDGAASAWAAADQLNFTIMVTDL